MNERIKELAEQAAKQHGHTIKFTPEITETLDIFAEWIVRECGVALSPMLRDMVSRGQAFDLIKEHFGVEECWCESCKPNTMTDMRMILCQICGNKRCPHATNHIYECTNSNEPGQKGSSWENYKVGVEE